MGIPLKVCGTPFKSGASFFKPCTFTFIALLLHFVRLHLRICSVPLNPPSSYSRHGRLLGNPQRRRYLSWPTELFVSSPELRAIRLIPAVAWNNISFHALNTVFAVVEVAIGRVPMPWGYLLPCVVTLGLYLGLAYMVHRIQDWYGTSLVTL